jgi:hypothetical protein
VKGIITFIGPGGCPLARFEKKKTLNNARHGNSALLTKSIAQVSSRIPTEKRTRVGDGDEVEGKF